jgi:hypothetical protein
MKDNLLQASPKEIKSSRKMMAGRLRSFWRRRTRTLPLPPPSRRSKSRQEGRGLSQAKDDDDCRPDESPAKRKRKSKKKRAGNVEQCGDAGREGLVDKAVGISFAATAAAEHKAEYVPHFSKKWRWV